MPDVDLTRQVRQTYVVASTCVGAAVAGTVGAGLGTPAFPVLGTSAGAFLGLLFGLPVSAAVAWAVGLLVAPRGRGVVLVTLALLGSAGGALMLPRLVPRMLGPAVGGVTGLIVVAVVAVLARRVVAGHRDPVALGMASLRATVVGVVGGIVVGAVVGFGIGLWVNWPTSPFAAVEGGLIAFPLGTLLGVLVASVRALAVASPR